MTKLNLISENPISYFKTDSGTNFETSPPFFKISLTMLDEIKEVRAAVNKKTVSILDMVLLACAMAFSN